MPAHMLDHMTTPLLRLGSFALFLSAIGCGRPAATPRSAANESAAQAMEKLAIHELLERFEDAVNHGQFELVPELFAADAVWQTKLPPDAALGLGEGFHFRGREGIRAGLAKAREQAEPLLYVVLPGPIELHGSGRASSRSTMHELLHVKTNDTALDLVGTYDDTFVERDGVWRFASRTFRLRYASEVPLPRFRTPR